MSAKDVGSSCLLVQDFCSSAENENIFDVVLIACELARKKYLSTSAFVAGREKIAPHVLREMSEPEFDFEKAREETIAAFKKPVKNQKWSGYASVFSEEDLKSFAKPKEEAKTSLDLDVGMFSSQELDIKD